ncbi:hypothetical protein GZ201_06015, partial [Dermatophilus congolensis]|nr:hypothetical protein [Dermatophilus congolensis]MBO3138594.1 hypothetical protein [Dermatophilus congolensis]MBO3147531.1 hypothetical protein [Dermatophilus congolensis]
RLPLAAAPAETWQHFADLAEHGDNLIRTTPARTILIANLTHHHATTALTHLSTLGLITDPHAPLAHVTTCTGLPGCTSALADVQYAAVTHHTPSNNNTPVHWSACPRRCGRPTTDHVQVLATETGWTTALVNTDTPGHPATNQHPVTDENLTTDITNRRQEITP